MADFPAPNRIKAIQILATTISTVIIAPYFEGGVLGSNGLALDLQGNLIICQHGDRRLAKLSLDNVSQEGVSNLVDKFEGNSEYWEIALYNVEKFREFIPKNKKQLV